MEEAPTLGSVNGKQQETLPLEDQITVDQFSQLMTVFHSRGCPRKGRRISMGDFRRTLAAVLGKEEEDEKIALLCSKIDVEDESCVKEDEMCSYLLQQLRERDTLAYTHPLPFQQPPSFQHNPNSKETLCRLMFAPSPPRYITVSKDGMVSIWTPGLQVQHGVKMAEPGRGRKGRKGTLWVTDCALMTNCHKLVVGTTSKELSFYDTTTPDYKCQYRIHDLSSVPLCMTYHCNFESPSSPSYLLYGDISGSVVVLTFPRPLSGLFHTSNKDDDTTQLIAYSCLLDHAPFVSVHCVSQLHPDWVRKVAYIWHNHSFLSCCGASSISLVARDISRRRNSYVFAVRKGVICFDYCHQLGLLVTGSMDHIVRLWNPYVPSRPMAVLSSHTTAILDVTINRNLGLVFSCSQDCVLCAWDVFEHSLVQSISIKFPFSQQSPDFGPSPLHSLPSSPLHPLSSSLMLMCNAFIAELKLGVASPETANDMTITSHKHPVTTALYNPHFHQVVSGCEGGEVSVWDVDSGRHVLQLGHCHGRQEITAMALDTSGRRLMTGSHGGEIKVWNYMSNQCVKQMSVCGEGGAEGGGVRDGEEVTGIIHLVNKFLTVGWNRRIATFPDVPDVFNVRQDGCWQGEDHHEDDILCVACCPPHYLATGSFDGELKVWNLDTEKVMTLFRSITKPRLSILKKPRKSSVGISKTPFWSQSSLTMSTPSRPTSRKLSAYRIKSSSIHLQHVPVDQLLFLRTRIRARHKGAAVLVSSEGGLARFWDIFGSHEPIGVFPLTEFESEIVLSLKTDPQDQHLIAGDTSGSISVFDISRYGTSPLQDDIAPDPMVRWKAHAGEVLSIEYVPHREQPLVLSASGDCTVRLWTLQGHYIGTFGQEQPWNLKTPYTFQHPSTPWKEPASTRSQPTSKAEGPSPRPHTPHTKEAPTIATLHEEEEEEEEERGQEGAQSLPPVQDGKLSITFLSPALADKSMLGEPYKEGVRRRMADRQERRIQFSGIDLSITERFGSLCSPFQALHVQKMEDFDVPKELSTARGKL